MKAKKLMIGMAAIAIAGLAQSAHARVSYICPEFNASTGELQVRVASGCMSSSTSYISNDLALEVDQHHAAIRITGDIKFGGGGPIQTADCMGAKSIVLTASAVEPRLYSLSLNGEYLASVSLLAGRARDETCLTAGQGAESARGELVRSSSYREWNQDPMEDWRDWRGSSVLGLLSPILDGHPEMLEGRPTMSIDMKKVSWQFEPQFFRQEQSREPFIAVTITQHGYLDDSVSGGRYFAEVRMDETGQWKLDGFWSQQMCARGANAGQWTGGPCV